MAGSQASPPPPSESALLQGLIETSRKVEASLLPAIHAHHTTPDQFHPSQGLDFLDARNTVLLSYLIERTLALRQRLVQSPTTHDVDNVNALHQHQHRLRLVTTVLDKTRGLDQKLRYQIDKLLAKAAQDDTVDHPNDSNNDNAMGPEDPLQFRPRVEDDSDDSNSDSPDDGSIHSDNDNHNVDDRIHSDDDDDLAAARRTLAVAQTKSHKISRTTDPDQTSNNNNDSTGTGVYQAPRVAAVPYTHDRVDRDAQRTQRDRQRQRASELAQTLREQYGDAPEQQDVHGGTELGRQREAARRHASRQAEQTRFEEDTMVRLTTTRKQKKERQRLMRDETSNLGAIADLGNLVRDSTSAWGRDRNVEEPVDDILGYERHANGKRRRKMIDRDGRAVTDQSAKSKIVDAKNSLQSALYGGGPRTGKKGKKGKR
jgi:U3 small nucleolar ribonucleoprotein protein LCP5